MKALESVFAELDAAPPRRAPPPAMVAPPDPPNDATPKPSLRDRFKLLTVADVRALPALQWIVHGVLPATGCAAMYGPSTSGKSFLALDLLAAVAEGRDWFGYRSKGKRPVVYIVLEGQHGIRNRVAAWEAEHGRDFPAGVRFVFDTFDLSASLDLLSLAAAIEDIGTVIAIDTLNRAAPLADENSSADMGRILEGVRELQSMTLGLVLLIAHSGKDAARGIRGHSSLFAALDAAIVVSRTDDRREWKSDKVKDDRDGAVHPFRLAVVDLGEDDDGDAITSCVIRSDVDAPSVDRPKLPKGGNQRIVYDAIGQLFRESPDFGRAGAPVVRPCIRLEAAIAHARDRLTVEPARRTERTRQALTGLITTGVLGCNEDWLWLK